MGQGTLGLPSDINSQVGNSVVDPAVPASCHSASEIRVIEMTIEVGRRTEVINGVFEFVQFESDFASLQVRAAVVL